jgi:hypothetical protein
MEYTHLDKNDGLADRHEAIELAQNVVFGTTIRTIDEHLRNALDRKLASLELERVRVGSKLLGVFVDTVGESG